MFTQEQAKESLREFEWKAGARHTVAFGPYRYALDILCDPTGRQEGIFAGSVNDRYYGYMRITADSGNGVSIVPVLPNRQRLLMVIEQRPAQGPIADRPHIISVGGTALDLTRFGLYSSLEFPGGALKSVEDISSGALRELAHETGIQSQEIPIHRTVRPYFKFGSDSSSTDFLAVAFLEDNRWASMVKNDGGLRVCALTPDEVRRGIWDGVIVSGHAALAGWSFYQEIQRVGIKTLQEAGYVVSERLRFKV